MGFVNSLPRWKWKKSAVPAKNHSFYTKNAEHRAVLNEHLHKNRGSEKRNLFFLLTNGKVLLQYAHRKYLKNFN